MRTTISTNQPARFLAQLIDTATGEIVAADAPPTATNLAAFLFNPQTAAFELIAGGSKTVGSFTAGKGYAGQFTPPAAWSNGALVLIELTLTKNAAPYVYRQLFDVIETPEATGPAGWLPYSDQVTNEQNEPLPGAVVWITPTNSDTVHDSATTDEAGEFTIYAPTAGNYRLHIARNFYESETLEITLP